MTHAKKVCKVIVNKDLLNLSGCSSEGYVNGKKTYKWSRLYFCIELSPNAFKKRCTCWIQRVCTMQLQNMYNFYFRASKIELKLFPSRLQPLSMEPFMYFTLHKHSLIFLFVIYVFFRTQRDRFDHNSQRHDDVLAWDHWSRSEAGTAQLVISTSGWCNIENIFWATLLGGAWGCATLPFGIHFGTHIFCPFTFYSSGLLLLEKTPSNIILLPLPQSLSLNKSTLNCLIHDLRTLSPRTPNEVVCRCI